MFYKWTVLDQFEEFRRLRAAHPGMEQLARSQVLPPGGLGTPPPGCEPPGEQELQQALFFLSGIGLDSMFKIILAKA